MSTSLRVTFFSGKKGGLICRLPSGKIGFPSRSFRTPPPEGEHCELIIEEEREKCYLGQSRGSEFPGHLRPPQRQ